MGLIRRVLMLGFNTPRRECNIRFDPEAASIVSRSPWRKIAVVPVDPSTARQLTRICCAA